MLWSEFTFKLLFRLSWKSLDQIISMVIKRQSWVILRCQKNCVIVCWIFFEVSSNVFKCSLKLKMPVRITFWKRLKKKIGLKASKVDITSNSGQESVRVGKCSHVVYCKYQAISVTWIIQGRIDTTGTQCPTLFEWWASVFKVPVP